jgi:hypothetical protein
MRNRDNELMITLLCSEATGTATMTIGEAVGASPATSRPGTGTEVLFAFSLNSPELQIRSVWWAILLASFGDLV